MSETFQLYGDVDGTVHVTLTLGECKALDALAGYGIDAFLKVFYEHMGKAYLQPYEKDLRSLFEKSRHQIPKIVHQIDEARAVFKGRKVALNPAPEGKVWRLVDKTADQ